MSVLMRTTRGASGGPLPMPMPAPLPLASTPEAALSGFSCASSSSSHQQSRRNSFSASAELIIARYNARRRGSNTLNSGAELGSTVGVSKVTDKPRWAAYDPFEGAPSNSVRDVLPAVISGTLAAAGAGARASAQTTITRRSRGSLGDVHLFQQLMNARKARASVGSSVAYNGEEDAASSSYYTVGDYADSRRSSYAACSGILHGTTASVGEGQEDRWDWMKDDFITLRRQRSKSPTARAEQSAARAALRKSLQEYRISLLFSSPDQSAAQQVGSASQEQEAVEYAPDEQAGPIEEKREEDTPNTLVEEKEEDYRPGERTHRRSPAMNEFLAPPSATSSTVAAAAAALAFRRGFYRHDNPLLHDASRADSFASTEPGLSVASSQLLSIEGGASSVPSNMAIAAHSPRVSQEREGTSRDGQNVQRDLINSGVGGIDSMDDDYVLRFVEQAEIRKTPDEEVNAAHEGVLTEDKLAYLDWCLLSLQARLGQVPSEESDDPQGLVSSSVEVASVEVDSSQIPELQQVSSAPATVPTVQINGETQPITGAITTSPMSAIPTVEKLIEPQPQLPLPRLTRPPRINPVVTVSVIPPAPLLRPKRKPVNFEMLTAAESEMSLEPEKSKPKPHPVVSMLKMPAPLHDPFLNQSATVALPSPTSPAGSAHSHTLAYDFDAKHPPMRRSPSKNSIASTTESHKDEQSRSTKKGSLRAFAIFSSRSRSRSSNNLAALASDKAQFIKPGISHHHHHSTMAANPRSPAGTPHLDLPATSSQWDAWSSPESSPLLSSSEHMQMMVTQQPVHVVTTTPATLHHHQQQSPSSPITALIDEWKATLA